MRELAEYDQEDDQTGDPRPELVVVHDLVAKDSDEPCRRRDYDNAGIARNVGIDGVDQLSADYNIHGRPAHTSEAVENCNCGAALVPGLRQRGKEMWGGKRTLHW